VAGRPPKQTVDYFPHYTDASQRRTLFTIQQMYGHQGYAFWFRLLELLGSTAGHAYCYTGDAEWQYLKAFTWSSDDEVRAILSSLASMGAIDLELWAVEIAWSQYFVDGLAGVYANRRAEVPPKPDAITTANNYRRDGIVLCRNTITTDEFSPAVPISTPDNAAKTDVELLPVERGASRVEESRVEERRVEEISLDSSFISGNSAAAPKNTPALLAVIALSAKNGIGESTISATLSAVCPRKLLCSVGTPLPRVIKLASCSTLLNPSALAASAISISFSFLSTICLGVSFVTKRSNLPLIKLVTPPLSNFLTPVGSDTSFIILSLPGICPNSTKDFPPVLNINPAFKTLGSTTINPAALASAAVSNFNLGTNSDIISSCATIFCLAIKLF